MNNIVPIGKVQGYTRMDNDLYEALISSDLSGRELRVALAIHRMTAGYQRETVRVAASYLSEMTGIARENVSRIISELLRKRVLVRAGGSRSPIGIAPVSEWDLSKPESRVSKTTQSVIDLQSRVSKTTHKKESKSNPLHPSGVIPQPDREAKSKPKAKPKPKPKPRASLSLDDLSADNPHSLPEQIISDWLTLRKAKRAPVTSTVWGQLNAALDACIAGGVGAEDAMAIALTQGWQGFKAEWILRHAAPSQSAPSSRADDGDDDLSWMEQLRK